MITVLIINPISEVKTPALSLMATFVAPCKNKHGGQTVIIIRNLGCKAVYCYLVKHVSAKLIWACTYV